MRYTLVWAPTAQENLARLWAQAQDRKEVTESANRIDQQLSNDPLDKGVPYGVVRAFFDEPLSVLFTVDEGDRMVRVITVRRN